MTRAEMKEAIRYALGLREPEEQVLIEKQIHLGILDVLRRTSCFVQCIDADVPDGKSRIELAAVGPLQKLISIERGGTRLTRVIHPALARYSGAYAQVGQIIIFSEPFEVGEQLQFYAVPRPPAMTDDADLIEDEDWGGINPEYQDAIELYACARLGSRADDGTSQMGATYWIMYVGQDGKGGRISEIKAQVNRTSGQTLGPAQLLYRP